MEAIIMVQPVIAGLTATDEFCEIKVYTALNFYKNE